jgi:hypothetical protein
VRDVDDAHTPLRTPDAELFGRRVLHRSGVRLGHLDVILHHDSGERLAVVRAGRLRRRWTWVSLDDAQLVDGTVIVTTNFGRAVPPPEWRQVGCAKLL